MVTKSSMAGLPLFMIGFLAAINTPSDAVGIGFEPKLERKNADGPLYVENEEENQHCFQLPDSPEDPSRERAPCPPGNLYLISPGDGPPCGLCPFIEASLQTYNPHKTYCTECVICPTCPAGYEVEEECTRTNRTKCRLTVRTVPQAPAATDPTNSMSTGGANKSPGLKTSQDKQPRPETEPSGPPPVQNPGEVRQYDIRKPKIFIPILSAVIIPSLLLGCYCWKYYRLRREHATSGQQDVGNQAHGCIGLADLPIANVYDVGPYNDGAQLVPDGQPLNQPVPNGQPLKQPVRKPKEEPREGACAQETDAMLDDGYGEKGQDDAA